MRDQGRLVEWFDEKGYGFIQPSDQDKSRVFLHIRDFARPGPRPIVGCALEYLVILDQQGRYRARQVTYLKASQASGMNQYKQHRFASKSVSDQLMPMQIVVMVYMIAITVLSLMQMLSLYGVVCIVLMNVLSYWLYAQDKAAAQVGKRRVPEQTLHILSFLGGWPAAWLAQQKLRHKTQKQPFRQIYFCTIILNILLLLWLIAPLNSMFH